MSTYQMTFQCPRCKEREQTWEGDAPKCGFDESGNFLEHNWNCATLNALREIAEPNAVWNDNQQNVSVIQRFDVGHGILSWYKSRGQTDDFRDGYFNRGTLTYAQQLLGDIEPDNGWGDYTGDDEE
jgi:hypothetical protein